MASQSKEKYEKSPPLGEILRPVLRFLNTDCLVLGGQIDKAHVLFFSMHCPISPARPFLRRAVRILRF